MPSLERGIVEEILDANLLLEACNMEMMLKMGELALRCVVKSPKNRPTMQQVARELEEALKTCTAPAVNKQVSDVRRKSLAREESFGLSINDVTLEKFGTEADDVSIKSVTMRCLDVSGIDASPSFDLGNREELVMISEETDGSESPSALQSEFLKIIF